MSTGKNGSIWTPANVVTCIRIACVPVWLLVAELVPAATTGFSGAALGVALFYMLISLTDKLDGYLARSRNEVTTFGKFLDPIADKLVVLVAQAFLLEQGMTSSWVIFIVVTREFLVSGLRMVVASKGVVIAASNLGKWKTATTMVAISGLLLIRCLATTSTLHTILSGISYLLLIAAIVLTAWSGIDYFKKSWKYIVEA